MAKPTTPQAYFDSLEGEPRDIANELRAEIERRWPQLSVRLAWGFPCWARQERVFSVIAQKNRCNLQLWQGAELATAFPDRIEGTGKSLRHVKVFSRDQVDDELIDIMDQAVKLGTTSPKRVR